MRQGRDETLTSRERITPGWLVSPAVIALPHLALEGSADFPKKKFRPGFAPGFKEKKGKRIKE
jgi:hypothetical protein